ncbi:MAG: hypothetical protein R2809_03840 [Flavobacteriales bacterium]
MDFITQGILLLNENDQKRFRQYLSRAKSAKRAQELFDLIVKNPNEKGEFFASRLYKPVNLNAYHSLRKLLLQLFEEFVGIVELSSDKTNPQLVLAMASFYLNNNASEYARKYLLKAASLAEKNGDYDTLQQVYQLIIKEAHRLEVDPSAYFHHWEDAQKRLAVQQKLIVANSIMRKRLADARNAGQVIQPDEIINEVFQLIDLRNQDTFKPEFILEIVQMIRSAIISSKNYSRFEAFVLRMYNRLENANAFINKEKLRAPFYYMIAHTLYRNRKLEDAQTWLEKLAPFKDYQSKYIQLKAAVESYLGFNETSIEVLENVLEKENARLSLSDKLNIQLNLVVYYFQSNKFKKANQTMLTIPSSENWIEKKMGKEWRFKKNMIEVILQYELGNVEIASQRIQSLEKYFSSFLQHPAYSRAQVFIKFVRAMISNPEHVTSKLFSDEVEKANLAWPDRKEDTQAITFFCWLKSKMVRRPYYEVLLDTIHSTN